MPHPTRRMSARYTLAVGQTDLIAANPVWLLADERREAETSSQLPVLKSQIPVLKSQIHRAAGPAGHGSRHQRRPYTTVPLCRQPHLFEDHGVAREALGISNPAATPWPVPGESLVNVSVGNSEVLFSSQPLSKFSCGPPPGTQVIRYSISGYCAAATGTAAGLAKTRQSRCR